MSDKEKQTTNKGVSVSLYAGLKFYDVYVQSMAGCRNAMLMRDYETWYSVMRQMFNWTKNFLDNRDKVKQSLVDVDKKLMNFQNLRMSKQKIPSTLEYTLRKELFDLEEKLFEASQQLLLKSSDDEDINIDWVKASRGEG